MASGETIGERAERGALLRQHYTWQAGAFISETAEWAGGLAAHSRITPAPIWNHAAWVEGTREEFRQFLAKAAGWVGERGRRPVVYVCEPDAAQLEELKRAGFEKFDEEAWMTDRGGEARRSNRASVVSSELDRAEFGWVFRAAFSIWDQGCDGALRREDGRARHYLLRDNGAPVCAGTLILEDGCACIYSLGTPPDLRGRGYAGELFRHILAEAREAGCRTIFLQVEHRSAAQRLYERCGFQSEFVRFGFRRADWRRPAAARTVLSTALGGSRSLRESAGPHARESRPIAPALWREHAGRERDLCAAAWAYLLHRYTGEEEPAFTFDGRRVALEIDRDASIGDWVRRAPVATERAEAGESCVRFCGRGEGHLEPPEHPLEVHFLGSAPERVELAYAPGLFSKEAIRRMAAHLVTILESMTADLSGRVGQIEILPALERRQLLVDWNQSTFQPAGESIVQMFEAQVERTPDAPALLFAKAGEAGAAAQMTYRQLNRRANKLAHRLRALGVGPEVFVGVLLDRSLEMIAALLAILKAGGACVPLDPACPEERIAFILRDAKAPVVLTQHSLESFLPRGGARAVLLDEGAPSGAAADERNLVPSFGAANAAYMIYTSGSTGQPKGVVIEHEAIANHCVDCRKIYGLSPADRILQFSSFHFDASLEQILPALISGAALVVRDSETWTTREFERKLAEFGLTVADIPTAYWHQLAGDWARSGAPKNHRLRLVIVGGEALSAEKLALWRKAGLPHVRLINAYGPTETTITAASYEFPAREEEEAPGVVPIGRPRGDRKAYVLDAHGEPVPIGVPGELHIGGSLLARGYHNRPELTAAKFIANPFSDEAGARLYKTGDLVRRLEDGNLEFLGRLDDQVKIRGFRIELGEIENCLRAHSKVREAVVLAREDRAGEKRLAAYVEAGDRALSAAELKAHLRARLPDYMVPAAVLVMERLPVTPSGKIDRRALPEAGFDDAAEGPVRGPEDPLELQLQLIFERVLKRAPIGVDISFFELGGDSLQALELLVQIEQAAGQQLPLGTLYHASTVQALATALRERRGKEEWSSLVPLQRSGRRAPLYFLHTTPGDILGYGNLVYRLGEDQPCYGFQSLGLKEERLGHRTVEEMAGYYVGLLRERQPSGPYHLAGWCYGGVVAVEMARLLKEQGQEVGLLALLETVAMPPSLSNWRYLRHRAGCFLKMTPWRWMAYLRAKARYLHEARIASRMRFRQVGGSDSAERDPRLARLEHVYNTNLQALDRYRSRYYDGKVVLFNAAEKDAALIPDPHYGWVGLAREVEIHEVPGNHDTMLTEPNVSALARKLAECLEAAPKSEGGARA